MRVLQPVTEEPSCDVGHTQRNQAMKHATGDWLAFMDDDDAYTPNAFPVIEANLTDRVPHIFQMRYRNGHILWQTQEVQHGNVGTPMFIVPNHPGKLAVWPSKRSGDYDFIRDTCRFYGTTPRFVEQVIALIRPDGEPPPKGEPVSKKDDDKTTTKAPEGWTFSGSGDQGVLATKRDPQDQAVEWTIHGKDADEAAALATAHEAKINRDRNQD